MSQPGGGSGGGDTQIGRAVIPVVLQDLTGPGQRKLEEGTAKSATQARRQLQTSAQIARNSIAGVMRGLGTTITNTALEPVISVAEGFERLDRTLDSSGSRMLTSARQIGGALLVIGSSLTLMGSRETAAQNMLKNAIENTGMTVEDYEGRISKAEDTLAHYGYTAVQTMNALTTITSATHNETQALDMLGEATNLAAIRHISLDSAARQVALTIGGGGRLFKQFNIQMQYNADGTKNYIAMNQQLADVMHGAASAGAKSFGGHIKAIGVEIDNFLAGAGQKYGPALITIGGAMMFASMGAQIWAARTAAKTRATLVDIATTLKESAATRDQTAAEVEGAAETEGATSVVIRAKQTELAAVEAVTAAYLAQAEAMGAAGGAGVAGAGASSAVAGGAVAAGVGESAAAGAVASTGASEEIVASADAATTAVEAEMSTTAMFFADLAAAQAASAGEVNIAATEEQAAMARITAALAEAQAASAEFAAGEAGSWALAGESAVAGSVVIEEASAAAGVSMMSVLGPIGLVVGAGLALAYAFSGSGDAAKQTATDVAGLTEAIFANNGAIDESIQKKILAGAMDQKATDLFVKYGVNLTELTKKITEGGPAWDEYLNKLRISMELNDQTDSIKNGTEVYHKKNGEVDKAISLLASYADKVREQIKLGKEEADNATSLTEAERERARVLGMTDGQYEAVIASMAKKDGEDVTQQMNTRALIAADDQLRQNLGLTNDAWTELITTMADATRVSAEVQGALHDVGTMHAEFDPILDKYQAWLQSSNDVTKAVNQQAVTFADNAKKIQDAEQKVTDAEANIAEVAKQGNKDIAKARRDLADTEVQAAKDIADAKQKVVDAEAAEKQSAIDVTDARAKAAQGVQDAIHSLRDLAENEKKARDQLLQDQNDQKLAAINAAQDALNNEVGLSQQEIIDKQNAIDKQRKDLDASNKALAKRNDARKILDDQHALTDTIAQNTKTRKEANKVIKQGIDQNPDVLKAEKAQKDATAAVTQAKKDEAQQVKDSNRAIKDSEEKLSEARVTAAKNNKKAIDDERAAESDLAKARRDASASNLAAIDQTNQARQANDKNRTSLDNMEASAGLTDKALKGLSTTMSNMDKAAHFAFTAKGEKAVGTSMVNLRRAIYETIAEAGGVSPGQAAAEARKAIPDYHGDLMDKNPYKNEPGAPSRGGGPGHDRGFARGGGVFGPGTATSDSIDAKLSAGEHIWTAEEVQRAGGHGAMYAMRAAAKQGMFKPRFAGGGAVDAPMGINETGMKIVDRLRNSGLLSILGSKFSATDKYGALSAGGWPNEQAVKDYIRHTDSLPYVFGRVGPDAFDCSGLVGEIWARLTGHKSFQRYFTTANEKSFFEPGPGEFTIGVTNNARTQHTAGRLGRLKFEARDSEEGIIVGSAAKDPESFEWVGHLKGPKRGTPTTGIGDTGASGHLSPSAARAAGRAMMPRGWRWSDLDKVFTGESGWRWDAFNPAGPAYGIPQALPPNKMASAGSDWHDNAATQIRWGLDYIRDRYGNPTAAEQHEKIYNWYDDGGMLQPGASMVKNGTGKPEPVLTNEQWKTLRDAALNKNDGGLHIDNVTFTVDMNEIDDIKKVVDLLEALPQAVRASRAGTLRRSGTR